MFYSPQLLTSRKGGFAVVWLAASIGVKGGGSSKKLTRKELLACDLVKACEQVASPAEPLALRLSSSLLSGIARVYQQQFLFFSSDVTHVHQALKKAFTDALVSSTDLTTTVDLTPFPQQPGPKPGAKVITAASRLTLIEDPVLAMYGYDLDNEIDQGVWYLPGEDPREPTPEFEIEGSFEVDVEAFAALDISPRQPTGAYQAKPSEITLEEPHLQDYMLGDLGGAAGDDFGTGEQLELGIFGEGEGLLEGRDPELDAALRASTGGAQTAGVSTSAGQEEDYGGDFFAGRDFGGEIEGDMGGMGEFQFDYEPEPMQGVEREGESPRARAAREHAEGIAAREGALPGVQPSSPAARARGTTPLDQDWSQTPSSTTRKRVSDVLDQVQQVQQSAKRQKKIKRIPIDRTTELTDEAFRTSRATYNERMAAERDKIEKTHEEKESHKRAMDLIFGPPLLFQGPVLSDFWTNTLANQMTPFEGGKAADAKRRLRRISPSQRKRLTTAAIGRTPSPFLQARSPAAVELGRRAAGTSPAEGRASAEPAFGKAGEEYDEGDFFAGRDFGGELAPERQDLGGMVEEYFPQEQVELGRGVSPGGAISSTRPSLAPWAAETGTFSEAGRGQYGGVPSDSLGGRVSLDQPQLPGARRSRTPSLQPPGSATRRQSSLGAFAEGDLGGFDAEVGQAGPVEGRLSQASSLLSPRAAAVASGTDLAALEQESQKFLLYIQRIASSIPTPSPPLEKQPLRFSDLVPQDETTASTAAQALYHTLSLAMKGVLKVRQQEAYGEIEMSVTI
ncbi:hypothetical protein JCM16303_000375 [Sporobolomyces ruberrimus]